MNLLDKNIGLMIPLFIWDQWLMKIIIIKDLQRNILFITQVLVMWMGLYPWVTLWELNWICILDPMRAKQWNQMVFLVDHCCVFSWKYEGNCFKSVWFSFFVFMDIHFIYFFIETSDIGCWLFDGVWFDVPYFGKKVVFFFGTETRHFVVEVIRSNEKKPKKIMFYFSGDWFDSVKIKRKIGLYTVFEREKSRENVFRRSIDANEKTNCKNGK